MRKIYWLFFFLLINFCILPAFSDEEKENLCEKISDDNEIIRSLPFKMAIPEGFFLHQLDGNDWLLLGEKNTLQDLDNQFNKDSNSPIFPLSGIIRMKLSNNVAQIGEKQFSGSDKELKEEIKKMGGTRLRIQQMAWGEYPLKIVEATIEGIPFRMGWIGLNCGGPVMCFNYVFPQGKKSYQNDLDIWNRFLNETQGRSEEEMNSFFEQQESLKISTELK